MAKGKYISFHDSDDWLYPSKLEICIKGWKKMPTLLRFSQIIFEWTKMETSYSEGLVVLGQHVFPWQWREEVLSTIGFFDSVRVSADSEYNIASKRCLGRKVLFLDTPFLVASVRVNHFRKAVNLRLDGAVSGIRLNYRTAYTEWHNSDAFDSNFFIPMNSTNQRRFDAPKEILP